LRIIVNIERKQEDKTEMKDMILECKSITKQYPGTKALDTVNMSIRRGDIYGFIGENGAGKTTLLRVISGLITQSSGEVRLFGGSDERELAQGRKRMGCIVEGPAFFPNLTARDNLEYYRIQRGFPDADCIGKALDKVRLTDTGKKKYSQFSLGMKQRMGVALAIMGNPDFLILDEPINGLDPTGIVEFRDIIRSLNEEYGMTILISSHILSELEQVAKRYGIIHKGRLVKEFTGEQLEEDTRRCLQIKVSDAAMAATVLEQTLGISKYEILPGNELRVYEYLDNASEVTFRLSSNQIRVTAISEMGNTLESYFLAAIGQNK